MHYKLYFVTALCLFSCNRNKKGPYTDYKCGDDLKIVHNAKVGSKIKDYMDRNNETKLGVYFIEVVEYQNTYSLEMSSMISLYEYKNLSPNKLEIINNELVLLKLKGCDKISINEYDVRKYLPDTEKRKIKVLPNGDTAVYRDVILYNPEVMKFLIDKDSL